MSDPTHEVLLVVETTMYYYVEAGTEEEAIKKATTMLDKGERDQNSACGWLKVLRSEVTPMVYEEKEPEGVSG